MTSIPNQKYDIDALFEGFITRTLTEEQAMELLVFVRANPENERLFAQSIMGDFLLTERSFLIRDDHKSLNQNEIVPQGFLREAIESNKAQQEEEERAYAADPFASLERYEKYLQSKRETVSPVAPNPPLWPLIAAIIAFILVFAPLALESWKGSGKPFHEFAPPKVARVLELLDPVWQPECKPLIRGQETENRRIALQSGTVSLEFSCGAVAVLEGPIDLRVREGKNPFCSSGRISVHVPPQAIGFTIDIPFGKVVDRGTNFFVDVTATRSWVGVDKGQVDFSQGENTPIVSLMASQALEVDTDAKVKPIAYDPKLYYPESLLNSAVEARVKFLLDEKLGEDRKTNADPNLLVRYDFMQNGRANIHNLSEFGQRVVDAPVLTSIREGVGPLRGTKGILIRDTKSSVVVTLPEFFPSVTLETTVRIDRLNTGSNVLVASDQYSDAYGGILWQILSNGDMQLHFRGDNDQTYYYSTPGVVSRSRLGTWMTLAVTFDAERKLIIFKAGERELSRHAWENMRPVSLGRITIGNVPQSYRRGEPRLLNGAMSEFKIYQ